MLIDCHQHVFWAGHDDRWLVAEMDRLGIDVAWLLTWYLPVNEDDPPYHRCSNPTHFRADGTHASMPLADLLGACRRYPHRFVPGYCPCPTEGSAADLFEAAYHIHGVRVCGEYSYRTLLDDPRCLELFRKAGELYCPVLIHMEGSYLMGPQGKMLYRPRWYGGTVANLERAMQACPQTIFIGHAPGFWREISGDADDDPQVYPTGPVTPRGRLLRLMREYPNLYADLSAGSGLGALKRDRSLAREFLIEFADRAMFGRDAYGDDLYQFLEGLDLPAAVREKIMFRNALKLVPLPGVRGGNPVRRSHESTKPTMRSTP